MGVQEWQSHDRVLHEGPYLLAEREAAAPGLEREKIKQAVMRELAERVAAERAKDKTVPRKGSRRHSST